MDKKGKGKADDLWTEEDVIRLEKDSESLAPIPLLDPGLPSTASSSQRRTDPAVERAERAASALGLIPQPPLPPRNLSADGTPLTKRQVKERRTQTAGKDWFDLPAPLPSELPRLHREVEALRLRNALDPKRFYRKEEGEGKGMKGLPKYFAIGTILPTQTPFGTPGTHENLERAARKSTLVDELVADSEAKRYAKRKFDDFQGTRAARGRGNRRRKLAKW